MHFYTDFPTLPWDTLHFSQSKCLLGLCCSHHLGPSPRHSLSHSICPPKARAGHESSFPQMTGFLPLSNPLWLLGLFVSCPLVLSYRLRNYSQILLSVFFFLNFELLEDQEPGLINFTFPITLCIQSLTLGWCRQHCC